MRLGPKLPAASVGACAFPVNETHVFFSGGESLGSVTSAAYLLEWGTWKWTELPNMPSDRSYHACERAGDDIVVVGGWSSANGLHGDSAIYSLASNTWRAGPDVPAEIGTITDIQNAAVRMPEEDTFAVFGGWIGDNNQRGETVLVYDAANWRWRVMDTKLRQGKRAHSAIWVPSDFAC